MQYRRFEDLPVWRDAADLASLMFEFTALDQFRRHAGLRDQLERAAFSVSNNIAEGFERGTTNELLAFLYIARRGPFDAEGYRDVARLWQLQISDFRSHKQIGKNIDTTLWLDREFEEFGHHWPTPLRCKGKESLRKQKGARPISGRTAPDF